MMDSCRYTIAWPLACWMLMPAETLLSLLMHYIE